MLPPPPMLASTPLIETVDWDWMKASMVVWRPSRGVAWEPESKRAAGRARRTEVNNMMLSEAVNRAGELDDHSLEGF